MKVERRAHPRGEKGTRLSLHEAAKAAAEGRLDPRTRAWAIEKIDQAGWPKGAVARAAVLLNALRHERKYIPDPTDAEFMASSACTLAGCHGLTFLGGDCDDLLIAYLAACGSVGIEGAVVGHGYKKDGQLSHVLAAIYDGKRWHLCDPSTLKPFGTVDTPLRERWVAVPSGAVLCDNSLGQTCSPTGLGSGLRTLRPTGDFVGVSGPLSEGNLGAAPPPSPDQYVVGDASQQADMAARAKWDSEQTENAMYEMWIKHRQLQIIREDYQERPISQAGAKGLGKWTAEDEAYYQELIKFGDLALVYGEQAGAAQRPVAWDTVKQTIAVLGTAEETTLSMDAQGNMTIGNLPGGSSGFVPTAYAGQMGGNPWLVGGMIVGGVVVAGLTYLSIHRVTGTLNNYIDYAKATDLGVMHKEYAKQHGLEKANEAISSIASASSKKARAEAEKARAQGAPFVGFLKALETGAYIAVGLGTLGLLSYGGLKLWRAVQASRSESPRPRRRELPEPVIMEAELLASEVV